MVAAAVLTGLSAILLVVMLLTRRSVGGMSAAQRARWLADTGRPIDAALCAARGLFTAPYPGSPEATAYAERITSRNQELVAVLASTLAAYPAALQHVREAQAAIARHEAITTGLRDTREPLDEHLRGEWWSASVALACARRGTIGALAALRRRRP